MLPALYDDDRRALGRLASMLIIGAIGVLPLTTQSSSVAGAADVRAQSDQSGLALPPRLTFPAYSVSRDPFVPEQSIRAKFEGSALRVGQGSEIGVVLPPNAGAEQNGTIAPLNGASPSAPIVRAIVLGDPARALVEVGGTVRVLGIGDRIGELAVAGITADGITLSDGTRLTLDVAHR
jgi:hypothetical protein